MLNLNYSIWIEAEFCKDMDFEKNNCNTDVVVNFEDGTRWIATFFTYKNIESLSKKNKISGDCLSGKYFYSSNMLLVSEISREVIEEIVAYLIDTKEFTSIFCQCEAHC